MTAIGTLRNTSTDTLCDVLTRLEKEGAACGHFNVADQVLLKVVIAAATEGQTSGTRTLLKSLRQESDLPFFLNADHTPSLAKATEAANAGFDSVGIDFSALPFAHNSASRPK